MNAFAHGLSDEALRMITAVFREHPEVSLVKVFGSRAKGTHAPQSDIDLAAWGELDPLRAEAIASDLEDLPLPNRFDVQAFDHIAHEPLREHIERVGIAIYERENG